MNFKWLPNALTIARCVFAGFVLVGFWQAGSLDLTLTGLSPEELSRRATLQQLWCQFAFLAFLAGAITDFLDGWLARKLEAHSRFGVWLDPIADKVLTGACLLSLAHVTEDGWWFILPAIIIMTREFLVSGLREFMAGRSVNMPVSVLAKWKTTLQLVAIGFLVGTPVFPSLPMVNQLGLALLWAAAVVTAQTGFAYYRGVLEHVDKPSQ